jgi:hypothetical protein
LNKKIIIVLAAFLFIFGCVNMDIDLVVDENGMGETTMTMDMSAIKTMAEGMGGIEGFEESESNERYSKENICETLLESYGDQANVSETPFSGFVPDQKPTCTALDDYKAKLVYPKVDLVEEGILTMDGTTAVLTLKGTGQEAEEMDAQQLAMMKSMGLSMTMTITMPGEITSMEPEFGIIENNVLKFDFLEHANNLTNDTTLTSKVGQTTVNPILIDENTLLMIAGGIIGLLIIVIIAIIVFKKKSKKTVFNEIKNTNNEFTTDNQQYGENQNTQTTGGTANQNNETLNTNETTNQNTQTTSQNDSFNNEKPPYEQKY